MSSAALSSPPPPDLDAIRTALRTIQGIEEVRLVGDELWIVRSDVDVERDYHISHALGDLVDELHFVTSARAGMVPGGVRVL